MISLQSKKFIYFSQMSNFSWYLYILFDTNLYEHNSQKFLLEHNFPKVIYQI